MPGLGGPGGAADHPPAGVAGPAPLPAPFAGTAAARGCWSAERKGGWRCGPGRARPLVGEGPRLGSWEESVRYFQERPRGYALASGGLQRISAAIIRRCRSGRCRPRWPGTACCRACSTWRGGHGPARVCTRSGSARRSRSSSSWARPAGAGRRRHAAAGGGTGGSFFDRPAPERPPRIGGGPRASIRRMNSTPPSERRPQRIAVLPGDGIGQGRDRRGGQGPRSRRRGLGASRWSWSISTGAPTATWRPARPSRRGRSTISATTTRPS